MQLTIKETAKKLGIAKNTLLQYRIKIPEVNALFKQIVFKKDVRAYKHYVIDEENIETLTKIIKEKYNKKEKNNGWNKTSKYCYSIGCMCSKCEYKEVLETLGYCQMKKKILELVRCYGRPKKCEV